MKIAIAGYGVEGRSNYAYWAKDPTNEITIVDERELNAIQDLPAGVAAITGTDALSKLDGFDLVIRTAGLAPYKLHTNAKIWSGTNEFFAKCPAKIIGVTGSKGKGTTASLIASILEAAGKKVWLVGNIGLAALDVLDQIQPDDIVVYELSSFQLWDIEASPQIAVVLFIEQEHLDVHTSMEDYVGAKARITQFQTEDDLLIYNERNQYAAQIAAGSRARKVGYPSANEAHVYTYDEVFCYGEGNVICSTQELRIAGEHNLANAVVAIDAVWPIIGGDPNVKEFIKNGFNNFKGLPHRLAYVATVNDVAYYDDSIATTPGSAIAALRAFQTKPRVIILGGSYKGSDFSELAQELVAQTNKAPVTALLIGAETDRIAEALDQMGFPSYEKLGDTTADAFTKRAAEISQPGGVVLLSPAAASFGLFKNYVDRGEQFIAAVKNLPGA